MLPVAMVRNQANEMAVAWTGPTPRKWKSRMKDASLTPNPEIEIGIVEIVVMIGMKMRRGRNGRSISRPITRRYTDTILMI